MVNFKEDSRYILLSDNFDKSTDALNAVIEQLSKSWFARIFLSKQISNIQMIRDNQHTLRDKCLTISGRNILQENEISTLRRSLVYKDAEIGTLVKSKNDLIGENRQLRNSLNELRQKVADMEGVVKNLTTTVNAYIKADSKENAPVMYKEPVAAKEPVVAKTVVQKKVSNSSNKKRGRGRPKKA
jgi:regulator of replication initiation timing